MVERLKEAGMQLVYSAISILMTLPLLLLAMRAGATQDSPMVGVWIVLNFGIVALMERSSRFQRGLKTIAYVLLVRPVAMTTAIVTGVFMGWGILIASFVGAMVFFGWAYDGDITVVEIILSVVFAFAVLGSVRLFLAEVGSKGGVFVRVLRGKEIDK